MASLPATLLTEEQYLRIEQTAETKSEFHAGRMFAMAGGTPIHALLANRIGRDAGPRYAARMPGL